MAADATLPVYWDDVFLEHEPPAGSFNQPSMDLVAVDEPHPDREERVRNIKHIIERTLDDLTCWEAVTPASVDQLSRVHTRSMIDEFREFCEDGGGRLDPAMYTGANERSYDAAVHAAGAAIQAAERAAETGPDTVPYALVRPSGHHAQPDQMDGFCFFNNVGVATEHARATGIADSVAIIDWDVHHGNGTQEIFYDRDDVLFVSLHADHRSWGHWHPQTGLAEENGTGAGEGYTVNVPLPHGVGDESYAYTFETLVEPVVSQFDPDLLLISAGQDGGIVDPLARNVLTKAGFERLGDRVRALAADHADGSLALVQEGGYQPAHLGFATLGALEGALGVDSGVDEDPFALYPEENLGTAVDAVHDVGRTVARHWSVGFEPTQA